MAERRRVSFKKTLEADQGVERRRSSADSLRRNRRERALQDKRRRIMEEGMTTMDDLTSPPPYEPVDLHAAVAAFNEATTAGNGRGAVARLLTAVRRIRTLLCMDDPPCDEVLAARVLPKLLSLLSSGESPEDLKLEAMWCMTNLAAGTHEQTEQVLSAAPYLMTYVLSGASPTLQQQACWVLGNIAADGDEFRRNLHACGALVPLARLFAGGPTVALRSTAAWALSNLAQGSKTPARPFADAGLFATLVQTLIDATASIKDPGSLDLIRESAWITAFLTAREDEMVALLVSEGIAEALAGAVSALCELPDLDPTVVRPVLRALANLLGGPDPSWTTRVMSHPGFVPALVHLLIGSPATQHRGVTKEALWVVSNLATNLPALVSQSELLPVLLQHLRSGQVVTPLGEHFLLKVDRQPLCGRLLSMSASAQFDLQREALFGLYNAVLPPGNDTLHSMLEADWSFLSTLLEMLKAPDAEVVGCCLLILGLIVERVHGGAARIMEQNDAEAIENLQYGAWASEGIKAQASKLLGKLYVEDQERDEEEEGATVTSAPLAGFSFETSNIEGRGRDISSLPSWMAKQQGI